MILHLSFKRSKSTNEIITRALNDGDIIKNCIIQKTQEIDKAYKIDAEEILLKLSERLKSKRTKIKYVKNQMFDITKVNL